jgi:hypothetical protein
MLATVPEPITNFIDAVTHASRLTYAAVGVGIFMAAFLFKLFFKDFSDFSECVRYWCRPDIISLFRGEWGNNLRSELRLFVWAAVSTVCGISAYSQFPDWFPNLFGR